MLRVLVLPVLSLACLVAQRRHDADSPDRGLPTDPAAFLPYDDEIGRAHV